MSIEVEFGGPEDDTENNVSENAIDPDEFFANSAFRMVYQTNNFFLPQLRSLIDGGEVLNLRPEYQRRLRWSRRQKSRLIESLLLNIPVPPVFLYETEGARYEVMDGQQRLNSVREFIAGNYSLFGLTVLKPLNGLRYSQFPPRVKRALDRASLSAIVLLLESETVESTSRVMTLTDIRRFIFDRLNTGGTKLNPQEIRNALNPGEFNKTLIRITQLDLFTRIFEIPRYVESDPNDYYENPKRQKNVLYATMGDCQLVLRYFALKEHDNIRGSMKSMLDRAMERKILQSEAHAFETEYEDRLRFLFNLFDHRPFRLPADERGRQRLSAAMYDASMVAINELWGNRAEIRSDKKGVLKRMAKASGDYDLLALLTGQKNTADAVRERISLMRRIFRPA